MAEVAVKEEGEIARPLKAYVSLIAEQFELAEKAGLDYYRAAGALLLEVREEYFPHDSKGFFAWAEKNFKKKTTQIRTYMAAAPVRPPKSLKNKDYTSMDDLLRRGLGHNRGTGREGGRRDWTAPVDAIAGHARAEQRRLQQEDALTRVQERQAEVKLGQRLIDIGYKVLAKELHPDKMGGNREAMTRLNRVRERLRSHV